MNTMETICSRKTIRSYTGENITADELNVILKAANASPVGMGQYDSMHLTVITNEELMNKIDAAGALCLVNPICILCMVFRPLFSFLPKSRIL